MTQRKSKKIPQPNSAIVYTAPVKPLEEVEAKTNTTVAKRPKKANSTTTGASKRTRSKRVVDKSQTTSETVHKLVEAAVAVKDEVVEVTEVRTLYERVAAWLTYKLYQITSPFRGY